MPSGYTLDMPNDVLTDAAVLSRKVSEAQVPFAVSRGGFTFRPGKEERNIPFDGQRSKIAGGDRVTMFTPTMSGTVIQLGLDQLADLEAGSTVQTVTSTATDVGSVHTITPGQASTLIAEGDLVEELTLTYRRQGGGTFAIVFPFAKCEEWELTGPDNDEGQVQCTFEARLGQTAAAANTDTAPYQYVITDPPAA